MGTRLKDIIFDRHEDHLYEDERAMSLTPYVMAERCLQVEIKNIFKDRDNGDYDTLTYILEGGFRGFHKFSEEDLIAEYKDKEESFYALYDDGSLPYDLYDDDPLIALQEDENGEVEHA